MSAAIKTYYADKGKTLEVRFWVQEEPATGICSTINTALAAKIAKSGRYNSTASAMAEFGDGILISITTKNKKVVPQEVDHEVSCVVLKIASEFGWEIKSEAAWLTAWSHAHMVRLNKVNKAPAE